MKNQSSGRAFLTALAKKRGVSVAGVKNWHTLADRLSFHFGAQRKEGEGPKAFSYRMMEAYAGLKPKSKPRVAKKKIPPLVREKPARVEDVKIRGDLSSTSEDGRVRIWLDGIDCITTPDTVGPAMGMIGKEVMATGRLGYNGEGDPIVMLIEKIYLT